MKRIICDECGTFLFDTEKENNGGIGVECQHKGFVYKNACLFSNKYNSLYFCNHICAKQFYTKNIPSTKENKETQQVIDELKLKIPEMAKECSEGIAKLIKDFKSKK